MRFWKKCILCLLMVCLLVLPAKAAENAVDYQFTGVDGNKVTAATHPGNIKLIIFTHLHMGYADALLGTLLAADWIQTPGLSVIVVDWLADSMETVRACVKENGAQDAAITFCMDDCNCLPRFLDAVGLGGSTFVTPISFLVDADGKVLSYRMGDMSANEIRAFLCAYVDGIAPQPTEAPTVQMTQAATIPAPTQAPTVPVTKTPTVPPATAPTVTPTEATTMPAQPTEVTEAPTEVTEIPTEATEMPPAVPTESTKTEPSQIATQQPTEPEKQLDTQPDNKLIIGIAVAVAATIAAGAFLIFWKRKD